MTPNPAELEHLTGRHTPGYRLGMVEQEDEAQESPSGSNPGADRDRVVVDRFRRLPPAVPLAATVAVVGGFPTVPLGPDGASGGDGD